MKVTLTIDAKHQLKNLLGEEPLIKLVQIRTTG